MKKARLSKRRIPDYDIYSKILSGVLLGLIAFFLFIGQVYGDPPEALYIDADGNVGIGTHTPTARLDVKGPVNVQSLDVAEKIGTGDLAARGKVTAQEVQVAGSVGAAQVNVAGVINAQKIVATGTIDSSPHWDSGWIAVNLTMPKFALTQNHNLGAIPSRYTLQYRLQSAPDEVYVLNGGDVLQLTMNGSWKPTNTALTVSVQYAGPFHFYQAVKFNTSQVNLEAFLVPLKPQEAKVSVKMPGPIKIAPPKVDITQLPFEAVLSPPGAFRILLWK